jgi:hypothetical protein
MKTLVRGACSKECQHGPRNKPPLADAEPNEGMRRNFVLAVWSSEVGALPPRRERQISKWEFGKTD